MRQTEDESQFIVAKAMTQLGKLLVGIGGVLLILGLIVWLLGDMLSWVGRFLGDIRIEHPGFSFYMPITAMVLVSGVMWAIAEVIGITK